MKITKEEDMKRWINEASYGELLKKWRFAPSGDPFFEGEIGIYYREELVRRESILSHEERVKVSKKIGWRE